MNQRSGRAAWGSVAAAWGLAVWGVLGLAPGAVAWQMEAVRQPARGDGGLTPPLEAAPARYDEPPPPPFDPVIPTWAPCQSLRTNRSLVLGHLWFGMDILGWSTKGAGAPPLVTTSTAGTPIGQAGILGLTSTSLVFGNEALHNELRPGGRLTIGWWLEPEQYRGIEFQWFELDGQNTRFTASDDSGSGIFARPVIDADTGLPAAVLTTYPGVLEGSLEAAADLQLGGVGLLYRHLVWASEYARLDLLAGYRHARLYDRLRIDESLQSLDDSSGFATGSRIVRQDEFRAINQFDGADLGGRLWWSRGSSLALTGLAKVALGASNRTVLIDGQTSVRSGTTTTTTSGGVLALPSNLGRQSEQDFGVLAEIGLGVEWQPACYWKFSLGYTWLYWSDVARAVSQIDRTIDLDQLAPNLGSGTRPAPRLSTTSFWAQGLTAGFVCQF